MTEKTTKDISKVSIVVEIDGRPHLVLLPEERWSYAMAMVSSLTDSGRLEVMPMPDGYSFVDLKGSGAE